MKTAKESVAAIKKAKVVLIITHLTEHDVAYMKGIKTDIIREINIRARAGVTEFRIFICKDGDVIVG